MENGRDESKTKVERKRYKGGGQKHCLLFLQKAVRGKGKKPFLVLKMGKIS
jgi:hypothetical protein